MAKTLFGGEEEEEEIEKEKEKGKDVESKEDSNKNKKGKGKGEEERKRRINKKKKKLARLERQARKKNKRIKKIKKRRGKERLTEVGQGAGTEGHLAEGCLTERRRPLEGYLTHGHRKSERRSFNGPTDRLSNNHSMRGHLKRGCLGKGDLLRSRWIAQASRDKGENGIYSPSPTSKSPNSKEFKEWSSTNSNFDSDWSLKLQNLVTSKIPNSKRTKKRVLDLIR